MPCMWHLWLGQAEALGLVAGLRGFPMVWTQLQGTELVTLAASWLRVDRVPGQPGPGHGVTHAL